MFLKAFDEVCIINENNHWVGVINSQSQSLLAISSKSTSSSSEESDLR